MKIFALISALFLVLHKSSALFIPNITSADEAEGRKAYVDVAQIRKAELKFFNNGSYIFAVELPCGVLNNRVLALEQLSRLKLNDSAAPASSLQARTGLLEGRTVFPSPKKNMPAAAVHSGQRCTCACVDARTGNVQNDVIMSLAFPSSSAAARKDGTDDGGEQQQQKKKRKKREELSSASAAAAPATPYCLYVEDGKWNNSTDSFIKSLAPTQSNSELAAQQVIQQCTLSFSGSKQQQPAADAVAAADVVHDSNKKKSESFSIDCRNTSHCEQQEDPVKCIGGGSSRSTFTVANGELVISIDTQQAA